MKVFFECRFFRKIRKSLKKRRVIFKYLLADSLSLPEQKKQEERAFPAYDDSVNLRINAFQRSFKTYFEFLVHSLFMPEMPAPYSKNAEYIIAFMASSASQLAEHYRLKCQEPLVSVIMLPPFDCSGFRSALERVIAQSYRNWEVILSFSIGDVVEVDSVLREFGDPRIKQVVAPDTGDPLIAAFRAMDAAAGDFLCYLDSSCTFHVDFILILASKLVENEPFDIAYCAQRLFERETGNERCIRFSAYSRSAHENDDILDFSVVMHRRSLLEKKGGFDPSMKEHYMWELMLRFTEEKSPLAVPAILASRYQRFAETPSGTTAGFPVLRYLSADAVAHNLSGDFLPEIGLMYSPRFIPSVSRFRPVSIIIPSFEAEPFLKACVASIQSFSPEGLFELIIVDNASSDSELRDYLEALRNSGKARVLFNDRNFGFTYAVNQGVRAASSGNDIVLLNNDAVVTRGWIEGMQHLLEEHPDAGLVVPRQVMLAGTPTFIRHQPYRDTDRECDVNISALHANVLDPHFNAVKGYMELSFAPFFCVYIPRMVLNEVGLLDVENGPHYRSDRLYCDQVRQYARKRIIYTPFSKVYHFHQRSTGELRERDISLYEKMFVWNNWKEINQMR